MKQTIEIITCDAGTDASSFKIRDNCCSSRCRFYYSKRGESWRDDRVECHCPIKLKKGQRLKITETDTVYRRLKNI